MKYHHAKLIINTYIVAGWPLRTTLQLQRYQPQIIILQINGYRYPQKILDFATLHGNSNMQQESQLFSKAYLAENF